MSQVAKPYRASLSKTQGRQSYAIIYRHPLRTDRNTGKPGLRVRSGLGTKDASEAERLLAQMNALLGDDDYWSASAEATARARFDARVVDSFFRHLVAKVQTTDSAAIREGLIPLPSSAGSDYRSALLIGAAGAGKTALLRQLMGFINNGRERFPATARCNATVADIEVIVAAGDYQMTVTFSAREVLRDALEGCLCAAVLAACRGEDEAAVLRKLLQSGDQRWRFDYILGNVYPQTGSDALAGAGHLSGDRLWESQPRPWSASGKAVDTAPTTRVLRDMAKRIAVLAAGKNKLLQQTLSDRALPAESLALAPFPPFSSLFEEALYRLLAEDGEYHALLDALLQAIEARFSGLDAHGSLQRDCRGYPLSWCFSSADRAVFITEAQRFASNRHQWFGRLLTPLVNGMRIKGPFFPAFGSTFGCDRKQPLVFIDGAGLKPCRGAATGLSGDRLRRIDAADAVIVVDSALQPMQGATIAVLQALVQSGNSHKLLLCFTQLDQLSGDDLPRARDKRAHIRLAVERAVEAIGNDLGGPAWQALRRGCAADFFFARLDKPLTARNKQGRRNRKALRALLRAIAQKAPQPREGVIVAPPRVTAMPVYDRVQLNGAINTAAVRFQQQWGCRVGLQEAPLQSAEHWTRIKTLSRYLANQWDQQYDTLMPVADLYDQLMRGIYRLLQQPLRWQGEVPAAGDQRKLYDRLLASLSRQLLPLVASRLLGDVDAWQRAYEADSAGARARLIHEEIIVSATVTADRPAQTQSQPLNHALLALFRQIGEPFGIVVE